MKYLKVLVIVLAATAVSLVCAASADAQARRAPAGGATARAVPRTVYAPGGGAHPGGGPIYPYHPYYGRPYYGYGYPYYPYYGYGYPYYPYGSGLTIGLGFGFPYGAVSVGYTYGYGYPYGYYGGYGYAYPYAPAGYVAAAPAPAYGGVRIAGAPVNAQVFADGYYAGIAGDFAGSSQHLDLTPGPHRIEIRVSGAPAITFDVQVQAGQTITYHADPPRS
jgi:hypothetical protein